MACGGYTVCGTAGSLNFSIKISLGSSLKSALTATLVTPRTSSPVPSVGHSREPGSDAEKLSFYCCESVLTILILGLNFLLKPTFAL